MRILIRHPEGNLNNNPNLLALTNFLAERGDKVDVWSPLLKVYQASPGSGVVFCFKGRLVCDIATRVQPSWLAKWLAKLFYFVYFRTRVPDLVIGIDREGVIDASIMASVFGVPYGMISYEIMFEDETGFQFKALERRACRHLAFCVCQDALRSQQLAQENGLEARAIIRIPVSGARRVPRHSSLRLRHSLKISDSARVAIYAGSLANWALTAELVSAARTWPEPWVLVLHGRYGIDGDWSNMFVHASNSGKVYFSRIPATTADDLSELLCGADLGVALYKPDFESPYTGKNLMYLGLSSGKLSVYVQHGLPVIVNEVGQFSSLVDEYGAGFVVGAVESIGSILGSLDGRMLRQASENAYRLFDQELDAALYKQTFLDMIDEAGSCHPIFWNDH